MSARFKVRLLNGPLADSEVQLPDGVWKIGGQDSDFAVNLERDAQAVLTIDESGVRLEGDAPYWIDGRRGTYPAAPLPLLTPIEIAGLGIVLAAVDQQIVQFRVPRRRSARSRLLMICLLAGLVVLAAALLGSAIVILPPNFRPPPSNVDLIVARLARGLGPDGVKLSYSDNVVTLAGRCIARDRLEAARRELVRQGVGVVDNVICEDDIVRSVRGVLELYGVTGIEVEPDNVTGYVVFSGHLSSDPRWAKVATVLSSIPGLLGWRVFDPGADATSALAGRLRDAGILDYLSVFRSGEAVLATGLLDTAQKNRLDEVLGAYRHEHPNGPRVIFQDIPAYVPLNQIFPVPLEAIGGNVEQPFAILRNGARLQVGDVMASGYQITAIHRDGVDVERNGDFVHAPVRAIAR